MLSCDGVQDVVNRPVRWAKTSLATVLLCCKNRGRVGRVLAWRHLAQVHVWVQSLLPSALRGGDWTSYTTDAVLPVSKSATQRTVGIEALLEKRKYFAPAGIRTLYRPTRSLLIVPTVGSRLCCRNRKWNRLLTVVNNHRFWNLPVE